MNFCSGTKKQSKNYKNQKQNKTKLKLGWAFYLLIFIAVRVAVTLSWYDIAATWVLKSKDKVKLTDLSVLLSMFIEYFVPDTVLEKH